MSEIQISKDEERKLLQDPAGGPIFEKFKDFKKPKIIPLDLESVKIFPIQGPHIKSYFTKSMIEKNEIRIKNRQIPVDLPLPVFANSIIRKSENSGTEKMDTTTPPEPNEAPILGTFRNNSFY